MAPGPMREPTKMKKTVRWLSQLVVLSISPSRPGAAEAGEHHLRNAYHGRHIHLHSPTVRVTDDLGANAEKELSITIS